MKVELYDELGNAKNEEVLTSKLACSHVMNFHIEKVMIQKILELLPKLKSREKVPPQSVIDEMR